MRKIAILICMLALVTPALSAGDLSLFGAWWSEKDPGDIYGVGFRLTGQEGPWAADLTVTWLDDTTYTYYWPGWGGYYTQNMKTVPVELGLRYIADTYRAFRPYAGGGFGYYFNDSDWAKVDDSWGFYGLVGFNWGNRNTFDFFAEGIYRWVDTDVKIHDPVTGDARYKADLAGFGINMGVVIHF